jgi:phosphatidylserine/phosphatidylglycerophosphate/cardiolipin synthase-like enzyme
MSDFVKEKTEQGFTMKLWRGERMCLIAFDVAAPEPDLVGFAIECKSPGGNGKFEPLLNRITFPTKKDPGATEVTGKRKFPSTESPFQKFRWVHFPFDPQKGTYTYRGTKMHMPADGVLKKGTAIELEISLDPHTFEGFVDVGFTRGFASSQAFRDKFPKDADIDEIGKTIIPSTKESGLAFHKLAPNTFAEMHGDIYRWMGFEARDMIFDFLDKAVADPQVTLDVFAFDFNEPDLLTRLVALGPRLRVIIDNSSKKKNGKVTGHGATSSDESEAASRLRTSAGKTHVKRTHFDTLQHHKVFIARRNGLPFKVLAGSTNFSFRGIYVQSNNALVFESAKVADLFGQVFDASFKSPATFDSTDLAGKWHLVSDAGQPPVRIAFSPHVAADLTLNPVRGAIDGATSSVFYAVAFLNQIGPTAATRAALDRLMTRPVFSYGVVDQASGLNVKKPDGSTGLADFEFLAETAPEPFKREWSGGQGINVHHKFVVTDFNLPTAKVFTGSSNLSPSGETGNGDHLIIFEDQKIAIAYAIEAIRVFDHLEFRTRMKDAGKKPGKPAKKPEKLTLKKPRAITGKPSWFEKYFVASSHEERDRLLFSH